MLIKANRLREAEPSLEKAVELNAAMVDLRLELADLYAMDRTPCRAVPQLEAFTSMAPDSPKEPMVRKNLEGLKAYCAAKEAP